MVSTCFGRVSVSFVLLTIASHASVAAPSANESAVAIHSNYVRLSDGVKIHYLAAGRRSATDHQPAILFIPGWTMPAEIWEPQIRHFAKTHFVVAMDPRSQGRSTKTADGNFPEAHGRDIRAVIERLHLSPVVLVGWSMGVDDMFGYVGQFGCQNVTALVIVDGRPWSWDGLDDPNMERFFAPLPKFEEDRKQATANFVKGMYKHPQSQAYLDQITQAALRTPTNTALALLVGVVSLDRAAALSKVDRPTLIVTAERPSLEPYRRLQSRIPGSRLEVVPGVGHALFADDPDRFNLLLETFLDGLSAPNK